MAKALAHRKQIVDAKSAKLWRRPEGGNIDDGTSASDLAWVYNRNGKIIKIDLAYRRHLQNARPQPTPIQHSKRTVRVAHPTIMQQPFLGNHNNYSTASRNIAKTVDSLHRRLSVVKVTVSPPVMKYRQKTVRQELHRTAWTDWSPCDSRNYRHRYRICGRKDIRQCPRDTGACSIEHLPKGMSNEISASVAVS